MEASDATEPGSEAPRLAPDDPRQRLKGGLKDPSKFMNPQQAEEFRRQVYELRLRGMSIRAIAKLKGKSPSLIFKALGKAKLERMKEIEAGGWKLEAGDVLKKYDRVTEICFQNLDHLMGVQEEAKTDAKTGETVTKKKTGKGTVAAAIWTQTLLKTIKQRTDFEMDVGIIQRASDKLDVTIRDARSMSLEELKMEADRIVKTLSDADIVPDAREAVIGAPRIRAGYAYEGSKPMLEVEGKVTAKIEAAVKQVEKALGED